MRKIIYAQLTSLDGYIEDEDGKTDWTEPGEELHRHFNELEKNLGINFYGRRMSEAIQASIWTTVTKCCGLNMNQPNTDKTKVESILEDFGY